MIASRRARSLPSVLLAVALLLAASPAARADDPSITWVGVGDALAKAREKAVPAVLVVGAESDVFVKDVLAGAFTNATLAKKSSKEQLFFGVADPARDAKARTHLADGESAAVVVTDLEGAAVAKFTGDVPGANKVLDAVKKAESISKKKQKVIEGIDKSFPKAQKLEEDKKYRAACDIYNSIASLHGQLADERIAQSQARLAQIAGVANDKLRDVDELIRNDDFARAQKALVEIRNEFPIPEVEEQVKQRQDKIAREMNRYNNP